MPVSSRTNENVNSIKTKYVEGEEKSIYIEPYCSELLSKVV